MNDEALLLVASQSRPNAVAGAIAGLVRDGKKPTLQAVGPAAVNQAVKAIAIARSMLLEEGSEIFAVPSFAKIEIEGRERTAVRLEVVR